MFATVGPSFAVRAPVGVKIFGLSAVAWLGVMSLYSMTIGSDMPFQEQDRLAVAADAGRVRLDDAERERHRNAGIDDVAAAFEDRRAGCRRERMAGRDDGTRRLDHRLDQRLLGDHRDR